LFFPQIAAWKVASPQPFAMGQAVEVHAAVEECVGTHANIIHN